MLIAFLVCVPVAWLLTIALAYSYGADHGRDVGEVSGWHTGHAEGWEDATRYFEERHTAKKVAMLSGREWMFN